MDISQRDLSIMAQSTRRPARKPKKMRSGFDAAVGKRLRTCRDFLEMDWDEFTRHNKENTLTWEGVTDLPPLKQSTFSQYETGARPIPGQVAAALAQLHGFTTDYLFRNDVESLPPQMRKWLAVRK